MFDDDSPSPRAVVGRILGLATAGAALLLLFLDAPELKLAGSG